MSLQTALGNLSPGAAWSLDGDDLSGLIWLDVVRPRPTDDEIRHALNGMAKSSVVTAIKAERDRRTDTGGYRVGTVWFHSDQKSRSQHLGLLALGANIPPGLRWKTMDGSYVDMTPGLAQQILVAAAASDIAIFAAAEAHIAALEGSDDPAGYDFSGGWPPMFGE